MKKLIGTRLGKVVSVLCAATLACGLIPSAAFAAPAGSPVEGPDPIDYEGADMVDGEILVQFDDAHDGRMHAQSSSVLAASVEQALDAQSMETVVEASADGGTLVSVELPEGTTVSEAVAKAKELPGVVHAQPNFKYYLLENAAPASGADLEDADLGALGNEMTDLFNDPDMDGQYYLGSWTEPQNGKYGANVANAWKIALSQHRVSVAILDTGIRVDHEDLQDNIDTDNMWDAYTGTQPGTITSGSNPKGDLNGHGTHVAGIAAGVAGNGVGIAGASGNANIVPIKVFDNQASDPGAETATLVKAYQYLMSRDIEGLHAVNMSLGSYNALNADDQALYSEIDKARAKGILTVCAGGNGDYTTNKPYTQAMYPSDFENVMSVTALEPDGSNASWSDYNAAKDISAPGVDIFSCYNASSKSYRTLDGTSMASPLVAGIASLLWAANPELSVEQVENAIYSTAHKIEKADPGYNRNDESNPDRSGSHGAIDATAAVAEVANGSIANYKRMSSCAIDPIPDVAWANSKANRPESVVVKNVETSETLVEGTDYALRISGDSKVGTAKVIAVGKGNYIGSIESSYNVRFDFATTTGLNIVLSRSYFADNGQPQKPTIIGVHNRPDILGTYSLVEGTDFTAEFPDDITSQGTKTVKITGIGNYMGEREPSYTIGAGTTPPTPGGNPSAGVNLSSSVISAIPAQTFTGSAIEPSLTVLTVSGAVLAEGTDYTVTFENNVAEASRFGLLSGYAGTDKFGPEDSLTRAQVAMILGRLSGLNLNGSENNTTPFTDNADGEWYTAAVNWAYANGVLGGYAGTTLVGPNDSVTREQLTKMICAWAENQGVDTSVASLTSFLGLVDNASVSDWATAPMIWATDAGIITGLDTPEGKMAAPQNTATRAQMAAMTLRALSAVYGLK